MAVEAEAPYRQKVAVGSDKVVCPDTLTNKYGNAKKVSH